MPIDISKVQWDAAPAAPAIDLNAVQWDTPAQAKIPGPRQATFLPALGRGAASLADVTVGAVLPAVAQQVVYPFARIGRSPEEAQRITGGVVSAVDKPFGKAFGVTETPEYKGEAAQRLMGFIGENFQKGAEWISQQTGVPTGDVENMMGSLTLAAPAAAKPVARAVKQVAAPAVEKAIVGAKMPFEKQLAARAERMSLEDYARGPQIDAAAEAQRLKIALNPTDIEPGAGPRVRSMVAGARGPEKLAETNKGRVREIVLNELDLPSTTQLNTPDAFQQARSKVAEPYDQVAKLPTMTADDAVRASLDRLRPDESLIGSDKYASAVNSIIDDAMAKTDAGLTGAQLLDNVKTLRQRARKVYNNKNADLAALDVADTNLAVANVLESMIESNVFDPKLLDRFRDARQKMARSYAYEGATDLNTGMVDVKKLARITAKDNTLTGDIASLGQIAGNFPDVFSTKAASTWYSAPRLSRSGAAGGAGALIGSQFGLTGSIVGGLLGGAAGEGLGAWQASKIASPAYQAGLTLRDMRIPVNQLAAPMAPIPQGQAIVPYQAPVEVLAPGEGPYQPNFVFGQNQYGPRVTPVMPKTNRLLGAPSAEGTINALRAEDARRAGLSRAVGQQAEAQQAAAEAAANVGKRTTNRPVELMFDEAGNLVPAQMQGAGGVVGGLTPLESAVQKMSGQVTPETTGTAYTTKRIAPKTGTQPYTRITKKEGETAFERQGQSFAMTAEEKIAWNKAKADLAEVAPGFKALSDKAIAEKMMDRAWVEQTAAKARQQAAAFEQIAARAADERARQAAIANRERMMDLADQMEETLRAPRPVPTGGQGPKTRAHQRNKLNMLSDQEALNKLLEK